MCFLCFARRCHATIRVYLPTNDTVCTCTNGSIKPTITTRNEANKSVDFLVPAAGTWNVNISTPTGTHMASGTVNIDRLGQIGELVLNYVDTFASYSWSEIIAACQNNAIPESWNVGDTKMMNIGGTNYPIRIIGKNHDCYDAGGGTEGAFAPITFQFGRVFETTYDMADASTDGFAHYSTTTMHTKYLPALLNSMPGEVRAAVRDVVKHPTDGGGVLATNIFLLSDDEFNASTSTGSYYLDGRAYAYYLAGNLPSDTQWTRTKAGTTASEGAAFYLSNGDQLAGRTNNHFVAPAFCF